MVVGLELAIHFMGTCAGIHGSLSVGTCCWHSEYCAWGSCAGILSIVRGILVLAF